MKNKLLKLFLIIIFFIFLTHLLKDIIEDILKVKNPLGYIFNLKEVTSTFNSLDRLIYYFFGVLSVLGEIFLTISIPLFLFKKKKRLLKYIYIVIAFLVVYFLVIYSFFFINQDNFYLSFSDKNLINYSIDNKNFKLLVADDLIEWQKGLMYFFDKKQLKGADGMIFIFPDSQVRSFWNKNTYLDLDIYWLDKDKVVGKDYLPNILTTKDPFTISSKVKVNKVIEIIR